MKTLCIQKQQLCCPNCGGQLTVLGTSIRHNEARGYLAECQELTCMTLVNFHIQITQVTAANRLINLSKDIKR